MKKIIFIIATILMSLAVNAQSVHRFTFINMFDEYQDLTNTVEVTTLITIADAYIKCDIKNGATVTYWRCSYFNDKYAPSHKEYTRHVILNDEWTELCIDVTASQFESMTPKEREKHIFTITLTDSYTKYTKELIGSMVTITKNETNRTLRYFNKYN